MVEKIKSLIMLFKKDKITPYVVERELSNFLGNFCNVKLIEMTNHDVNKSFGFFACPERLVEGLRITFFVDTTAILELYTEDEVACICERLRNDVQKILRKYNNFIIQHVSQDLSKSDILGFVLNLYATYSGDLICGDKNIVPDIDEMLKLADKFSTGMGTEDDIEKLLISDMICREVLDYCQRQARIAESKEEIKIKVSDTIEKEIPTFCLGQQEIRKYCGPDVRGKMHNEIPYDYTPKTNQ